MRAILFDLDGTLFDTSPDFIFVLNLLRRQERLPPLPDEEIRNMVTNGSKALVKLGFEKEEGDPGFDGLLQRLHDLYRTHLSDRTIPFPGIEALLNQLAYKGIPWGIVTNKPMVFTFELMKAFAHLPAPETVICPDHVKRSKPDPEPLLLACRQIGCPPSEAIYIGDHQRDITAGQKAGMATIACRYGYIDASESPANWGADHLVNSAEEIWSLLKKHYLVLEDKYNL
ncbi:HAD family hydrolase [Microbulbifer sp. GL-2]|uniref:HAD family hydrolase n=1 Tax=Microbulbifer sp. GL-2 TaxID=2591606 RepID=UPI001165A8AF|nr:HAD-IA family hydrolase [Microbulbifer sp. GL-2]BBM04010.1 phosphoglycolate phosphatase 2 [Microbulbifer sp. GL-2]